jgi:hypothetical protein
MLLQRVQSYKIMVHKKQRDEVVADMMCSKFI